MMNNYLLGILWGCGNYSNNKLVLRHKERYFLDSVQEVVGGTIYSQEVRGITQYVLKNRYDITKLKDLGWTERNSSKRYLPLKANADFIRAYLELHSVVDWQTAYTGNKSRKYKKVRLRIYGNTVLIDELNHLMIQICGTMPKTPQRTVGKTTMYLSFGSQKEISQIYNALYRQPCHNPYWDKYKSMMIKYARTC